MAASSSRQLLLVLAVAAVLGVGAIAFIGGESLLAFFVEPAPDVESPLRHDERVEFSYPGNWRVEVSDMSEPGVKARSVTVESKGSALAVVQWFEPAIPLDTGEYAASFVGGMQQELAGNWAGLVGAKDVTIDELDDELLGTAADGKRIRLRITLLGEKVPVTIEVRRAMLETLTVVLLTMVADEDRGKVQPGFDLIRSSLSVAP